MSRNGVQRALLIMILVITARPLSAQIEMGAQAVGVFTRVDPATLGRTLNEGYITQPALFAHGVAMNGALDAHVMLNFEGLTLKRGELNPGISGEGYVDRRHPHTYLHEATLSLRTAIAGVQASATAGRGFAPFGTDDPMVRPFVAYSANHHLSQILERLVAIGALRRGALTVEAGVFNGDEPTGPSSLGRIGRFGDSWSARATLQRAGFELAASDAHVASPEVAPGGGLDQHKQNYSLRAERMLGNANVYGLAEYSRTSELHRGAVAYTFRSYLAEASATRNAWRAAARYENTTRPEEERLIDPFRSVQPATDNSIVGRTRFATVSLQLARSTRVRGVFGQPFVEIERTRATALDQPAVYDPPSFYGSNVLWTFSAGVRVWAGMMHMRMGRYGVAQPATTMQMDH